MQSLEIISVNIWQILISLCNLLLLSLILKKFLFKPVKKAMDKRREEVDNQYKEAQKAEDEANSYKNEWQKEMDVAQEKVDDMIKSASLNAKQSSDKIIADAKDKADEIIRQAKDDAELERKKVYSEIKHEIVDVSAMLTEKMLNREISKEDHRELINEFIEEIGEDDGGNK